MSVKTLQVKGTKLVDCFWGKGWKHWVRVKITSKKPMQVDSTHFTIPSDVWSEIVQKFSQEQVNG